MGTRIGVFSSPKQLLFLLALVGLGLLVFAPAAVGQRGLNFYTAFPAVVVAEGKELSLEVKLVNTGLRTEDVSLAIEGPEGWNARFETTSYPTIRINIGRPSRAFPVTPPGIRVRTTAVRPS